MSHIENIAEEMDSCAMINHATDLDDLAAKLNTTCLLEISYVFITKESKSKARMVDLLSSMAGMYKLVKLAGISPIYVLQDHYDWEKSSGFYFVIGMHEEIKHRLLKLYEDKHNRSYDEYFC